MHWSSVTTSCVFPMLFAVLSQLSRAVLAKSVAATVAIFVIILQLYLIKTQARRVPAGQ